MERMGPLDTLPGVVIMMVGLLREKLVEASSATSLDEAQASLSEALSDLQHLQECAFKAVPFGRTEGQ